MEVRGGGLFHDTLLKILLKVCPHLLACALHGYLGHVGVDHEVDKLFERCLLGGIPAQFLAGLRGVAPEVDDVGGTVEVGRHLDDSLAGLDVDALLVLALALETQLNADAAEGQQAELAHGVLLAGGNHIVVGLGLLQDEPHALYIVLGIAPVAERGEVAQIELLLLALCDAGGGEGNLAGHECLATALGLVVEEDARAAVHVVSLAILLDDPEAVELGHGIGGVGMEGCLLVLGHLLDLAVELGGRSLIDAACVAQTAEAHSLEDAENTGSVDIGRELGRVERYLHVALCREVVDFVGTHLRHNLHDRHRVAQVGVVEVEMRLAFEVGDALAEIDRRAADGAVHVIPLLKQELGQEATVLAGDTGD